MLQNQSTGLTPEIFFKAVNGRITLACRCRSRGAMIPVRAGPGKSTRSAMADDARGRRFDWICLRLRSNRDLMIRKRHFGGKEGAIEIQADRPRGGTRERP